MSVWQFGNSYSWASFTPIMSGGSGKTRPYSVSKPIFEKRGTVGSAAIEFNLLGYTERVLTLQVRCSKADATKLRTAGDLLGKKGSLSGLGITTREWVLTSTTLDEEWGNSQTFVGELVFECGHVSGE